KNKVWSLQETDMMISAGLLESKFMRKSARVSPCFVRALRYLLQEEEEEKDEREMEEEEYKDIIDLLQQLQRNEREKKVISGSTNVTLRLLGCVESKRKDQFPQLLYALTRRRPEAPIQNLIQT
ncbi:unnamed protein product, partial [Sphagnum tenellum]